MTRSKAAYGPDPAMQAHYDRRYARYLQLTEALRPLWTAS
jgi:L-xylulokinase